MRLFRRKPGLTKEQQLAWTLEGCQDHQRALEWYNDELEEITSYFEAAMEEVQKKLAEIARTGNPVVHDARGIHQFMEGALRSYRTKLRELREQFENRVSS